MSTDDLGVGPIDIVVIGYPKDSPLTGEAATALVDLVDRGIIRVLDALFVIKNEDGTFSGFAAQDLEQDLVGDFAVFEGASSGLLGDADVEVAAQTMEPGEAVAVIMFENTWAAPFASAVRRNGGYVLDYQRIPYSEVVEVLEAVEAAEAG
jgi:hypothetical protein